MSRLPILINSLVCCLGALAQGGGFEKASELRARMDRRVSEIRATANLTVPEGVPVRFVSEKSGDDTNAGVSSDAAWRTIGRLNAEKLMPGAVVLFERGGTYRGSISAQAGVTYGSYGIGEKPRIVVSPADGADPSKWRRTDASNIWAYAIGHCDVGTLVFDGGVQHAIKVICRVDKMTGKRTDLSTGKAFESYRDLDQDLHFWHDYYEKGTGCVYLYSKENPGKRFHSIEFNVRRHGIFVDGPNVVIDNLCIKYAGYHGIGAGTCRGLHVTNCEFAWIGGSIQSENVYGRDFPTRFGNGVEIYGGCDDFVVSNCYFRQIYDAGATHQFNIPPSAGEERFDHRHVRIVDNVFSKCNYSIEYFLTAPDGNLSLMDDVVYERNLMFNAGRGFCEQRPDKHQAAHIKGRYRPERNRARDFVIRDNVFCLSRDMLIETCAGLKDGDHSSLPRLEGNVFWGRMGDTLGDVSMKDGPRRPYDESSERFLNSFGNGNRCILLPGDEKRD